MIQEQYNFRAYLIFSILIYNFSIVFIIYLYKLIDNNPNLIYNIFTNKKQWGTT